MGDSNGLADAGERPAPLTVAVSLAGIEALVLVLLGILELFALTGERVTMAVQIRRGSRARLPVAVHARVLDAEGRAVWAATALLEDARFNEGGVADCGFDLPVATMSTGAYLLRVDVTSDGRTETRDVLFDVK